MTAEAARRRDWVVTLLTDVGVWALALVAATLFRFEFATGSVHWASVVSVIVLTAVMQLVAGYLMGFYRGRYGYGTFEEVRGLTALVVGVSVVITSVLLVVGDAWQVPRSLLLIAGPIDRKSVV